MCNCAFLKKGHLEFILLNSHLLKYIYFSGLNFEIGFTQTWKKKRVRSANGINRTQCNAADLSILPVQLKSVGGNVSSCLWESCKTPQKIKAKQPVET